LLQQPESRMIDMMTETNDLQDKLHANSEYFISKMRRSDSILSLRNRQSVQLCSTTQNCRRSSQPDFSNEGIYVIGFYYPVVPKDQARIRVQISAAHETAHLDKAVKAFTKVGKETGVIK
jgi:glycine C-acetyltransferase